MFSFFLGTVLW